MKSNVHLFEDPQRISGEVPSVAKHAAPVFIGPILSGLACGEVFLGRIFQEMRTYSYHKPDQTEQDRSYHVPGRVLAEVAMKMSNAYFHMFRAKTHQQALAQPRRKKKNLLNHEDARRRNRPSLLEQFCN